MLSSERAFRMNVVIMRVFVRLRELLATHKDLARKIDQLAAGQKEHGLILAAVGIYHLKSQHPMLRDEDQEEIAIDRPVCDRSFTTFASLDDHLAEHEGPRQCHTCGKIHGPITDAEKTHHRNRDTFVTIDYPGIFQ
jgi:hypothetical protein